MNFNMNFLGLKEVTIERMEEQENRIVLYVSLPRKEHTCPSYGASTNKVHDYRMQKIEHLKWFDHFIDWATVETMNKKGALHSYIGLFFYIQDKFNFSN